MLTKEKLEALLLPPTMTTAQREAVLCEKGPILVSASAGSGKTFVLTTRVVYQLANPEAPLDPSRLLVVTFTRAAAKEMRSRITTLFQRLVAEFPTDRFLLRQRSLLPQAKIMTIDSFCAGLLREEFQRAKISPEFRMASEQELALLQKEVLEELLEEEALKQGDTFEELCDYFSLRGDEMLQSLLLKLYEVSRTHPFPKSYLKELLLPYRSAKDWNKTPWFEPLLQYLQSEATKMSGLVDQAINKAQTDSALYEKWKSYLEKYRSIVTTFQNLLSKNWEEIVLFGETVTFPVAPRYSKKDTYSRELADQIKKNCLMPVQKNFRTLQEQYLWSSERALSCLSEQRPIVEQLVALTEQFTQKMQDKMNQKNLLGFADLILKVMELLFDETTKESTPFGRELSERFDAIFVDEFQDINETQNQLFTLLAGEQEKKLFLVGDVKQSIYRFRYANPNIFLEWRKRCQAEDRPGTLITLSENFRSRSEVTGTVNDLFSRIMTESFGGIPYRDSEQLLSAGSFPVTEGCQTELHYLPSSEGVEGEAEYVAYQIAKMLREKFPVTENGKQRPCQPGDFAILLRSGKEYATLYLEALRKKGVCARTDGTNGYFQAREVVLMISLLQVINNPTLDLPMASILLSPLFSFTPDDLMKLRQLCRGGSLFDCLSASEDSKSIAFLKVLQEFRRDAALLTTSKLIQKIYDETLFYSLFGACESSDRKLANLRLMLSYADEYERGQDGGGLAGFLRFLKYVQEAGKDFEAANPAQGKEAAVHILTIHKSKGLEFPVVFLARCGKEMMFRELQGNAIFSSRYGITFKHAYPKELTQFLTVPYLLAQQFERRQMLEEEMRILYVAMTRAEEKLILTAVSDVEKKGEWLPSSTESLSFRQNLLDARSYADWLTSVFVHHPQATTLRTRIGATVNSEAFSAPLITRFFEKEEEPEEGITTFEKPNLEKLEELREALSFVYPRLIFSKLPAKLAVTELTRMEEKKASSLALPNFTQQLTPAERGTANHTFLQFADFSKAEVSLEEEIARMVENDYLTTVQAKVLDREGLTAFFESSLYRRMKKADFLWREFRFLYELPAEELQEGLESGDMILIQGIADCVIKEGDQLAILDYKTDHASSAELRERYRTQLEFYRRAISQTLGRPVKELLLYSLSLRDVITI